MSQNYKLPAPLDFSDKYGKAILTSVMAILFVLSLGGYVYLNFFSKPPGVTDSIVTTNDYEIIAIHQSAVRPGDEKNTFTVKVVPNSGLTTEIPVSVKITEMNPALVILYDEREKSFKLPTDQAQMQAHFDLINVSNLPDNINFKVEVKQSDTSVTEKTISIKVSKISSQQFALISALVTGLISLWLFFGQEILKSRVSSKKEKAG